ncbi:MAG: DUF6449 domain-containing protein [Eubacteriales bacterium]|nr:DUF6449 domain-containing protein [Eubacteriales bacterium]
MTSKISFSKLQKENLRHRIGTILIALFYFLLMILTLVIRIQGMMAEEGWRLSDMRDMLMFFAKPNPLMLPASIFLGVFMAISGFAYLHSRTKVDFYHSMAVKRQQYFDVIAASSLLIFAAAQILITAVSLIIINVMGFGTAAMTRSFLFSILYYCLIFAMSFLTAALAMIMTGTMVVGVLGTIVFLIYPIVIRWMPSMLGSMFFRTYADAPSMLNKLDYFSVLTVAVKGSMAGKYMVSLLIGTVLLSVLCRWLFVKRPSEAAGQSMAFPKVNGVIRVLLVVPAAMYAGGYFFNITIEASLMWMLFGVVAGTIEFHGVVEAIFQADIRALWSKKKQMAATMVAVLGIVGCFYFDIFGYESYVPKTEDLAYVKVVNDGMLQRKWIFWGEDSKGARAEEAGKTMELLREVAKSQRKMETENTPDAAYITYYLKNGAVKKRNYILTGEQYDAIVEELMQSKGYKEALYSLYTADWSKINNIRWETIGRQERMNLTEEEKQQFLTIYLSELDALTYEEMKTVMPTAELIVSHGSESQPDDYYFIYPSFTKTLAFLESQGKESRTVSQLDITKIEVIKYDEYANDTKYRVTDPAVIAKVKDHLWSNEFTYGPEAAGFRMNVVADAEVTVYYLENGKRKTLSVTPDEAGLSMLDIK